MENKNIKQNQVNFRFELKHINQSYGDVLNRRPITNTGVLFDLGAG